MTPERWSRVRAVFFAALDVHPDLRSALLDRECHGDDALKDEIVSLLGSSERAKNFLTSPAAEIAAGWDDPDGVAPGRLGPWQIRREIGRGGMAAVYLCERADGQFEKRAAVKILKLGLHGDDVLARFARERQLLADLDHPNIVRLLDGGVTGDGRPYLVMDFVDGSPISTYVAEQQPSTGQRLALFLKICDAVRYAHSLSIIHRDIKPGNILVTRDGTPKLLDFGIAKLAVRQDAPGATEVTRSPSRYFTLEYASPEQVRGEAVSGASDVYSLGLVLCQILTGRAPFDLRGLQPYEAGRVVCEDSPDFGGVPPGLVRIVKKATQKSPRQRYPAVEAFAGEVRQYLDSPERRESRTALFRRVLYTTAVLAAIIALALALGLRREGEMRAFPLTAEAEGAVLPSFSPDGKSVVYTIYTGGRQILMRKDLDGSNTRPLTDGSRQERYARWSPDGKWIAQVSGSGAWRRDVGVIPAEGGTERKIATSEGIFPAWTPDSKSLVVADRATAEDPFQLVMLGVNDGSRRELTAPERGHWGDIAGAVSPDGRWLAINRYSAKGSGDLYVMPMSGGQLRRITQVNTWINGFDWMPNSREVLYNSCSPPPDTICGLWRIAIDGAGSPRPLPALSTVPSPEWPSISRGKSLRVAVQTKTVYERLWSLRLDSPGARQVVQTTYTRMAENPSFSSDGRQTAFVSHETRGHNIWIADADFRQRRQLTFLDSMETETPRWSPSGNEIAFMAFVGGLKSIYIVEVASGKCRRLTKDAAEQRSPAWSSDGRWICFRSTRGGQARIWRIRADGVGDAAKLTDSPATDLFSVGGDEILFLRSTDGSQVWKTRFEGGMERPLDPVTLSDLREGYWTVARDSIYFLRDPKPPIWALWRYELASGKLEMLRTLDRQPGLLRGGIGVRPDGSALYWTVVKESPDLAWIENIR